MQDRQTDRQTDSGMCYRMYVHNNNQHIADGTEYQSTGLDWTGQDRTGQDRTGLYIITRKSTTR